MARPCPEGVLEDDGLDRGIMFAFRRRAPGAAVRVRPTQVDEPGDFLGAGDAKDPIAGPNDGDGTFTIPRRPIRRRLQGLPRFVITRGGEYAFMPGLRALRWLADLNT